MNIKEVSTRQFAGIKGKQVNLEDGLNVIVGKNETGKSTIVELIYQILFTSTAPKMSSKEGKDFSAKYFPSDGVGDMVDGKLTFTTADGVYTLQKKWGKSSLCEIVDEKGTIIEDEDKIKTIIESELVYKKGLYDDVVFTSQKSQANVVEHILSKLDKKAVAKADLVSIIASEGMASTGGIVPEDVAKKIQEKIAELSGHWDFTINAPEKRRGIENKWIKDVGTILEAYYVMAELEEQLRLTEEAEKAIDIDNANILTAQTKHAEAVAEKEEYERYAEVIATYKSGKKLKEKYSDEKQAVSTDLKAYPELLKKMGEASTLRGLAKAEKIISKYNKAKAAKESLENLQNELMTLTEVSADDETLAMKLEKDITKLQAKLSNLNLVASIKKLGDKDIQVKSVVTGKEIDITSGQIDINETVEITIPGIMSMTIAARGVDAEAVQADMQKKQATFDEILKKYHTKDLEDLKAKKDACDKLKTQVNNASSAYEAALDGEEFAAIADEFEKVKDKAEKVGGLQERIEALCGRESIESFAGKQEQLVEQIEEKYGKEHTIDAMEDRLSKISDELEKLDNVEKDAENIPEKYLEIEDTDAFKAELKGKIDLATSKTEEAKVSLSEHEKKLGDKSPDDLRASIEDAKIEFTKLKDECLRWNHILDVLNDTKNEMAGESTMGDVQEKFAEYLSVITSGRIALQSMDENMDVKIFSGENPLKYDILSEGTKDTIALAFRLAMLEHLFPNGGGLVVLDDPFTEMDEDRTKQACKLVQKFADAGNQVIFVTCDNKYSKLLSGNLVEM